MWCPRVWSGYAGSWGERRTRIRSIRCSHSVGILQESFLGDITVKVRVVEYTYDYYRGLL